MLKLTIWDHAFVLLVIVIYPIYSAVTIKNVYAALRIGSEGTLISTYKEVIVTFLLFAVSLCAIWVINDRAWAELGILLTAENPLVTLFAIALATAVIALVVIPLRFASFSTKQAFALEQNMGDMLLMMPKNKSQEFWFFMVSVNAGITEELIYRGFLLWYLQHYVGLWWAAALAILAFGLAHLYQGVKQLPGIIFISTVAMALYLISDSLLVPIIFHLLLDALQGFYLAKIHNKANQAG